MADEVVTKNDVLKSAVDGVLSLIGNVDHSTGNGPNSAKMRGELLNDIRTILSKAVTHVS